MRTDEILQNATMAVITNDNLFEMANLRQHQTGVSGTITSRRRKDRTGRV